MPAEPIPDINPYPFQLWQLALRDDCVRQGKLLAFNAMSERILEFLWQQGIGPSVQAILESVMMSATR